MLYHQNMSSSTGTGKAPFRIKKYECLEFLGGNMAHVYRAHDPLADRQVVVKLLKPEDARNPELRERFVREARLACRCSHPNIVATFETDEHDGQPYIVMEYLEGRALSDLIDQGALETQADALWIALQVARALEYVHSRGIVHRDIKPENIHIGMDGRAKLIDFGVARFSESQLTKDGQAIGTPQYMSPEQVKGTRPTAASDVYSFGVLLFKMLTLASPYHAETMDELWVAILNAEPDLSPLSACKVPPEITRLIERCLQKNASRRFDTFQPVCEILSQYVSAEQAASTGATRATKVATSAWKQPGSSSRRKWIGLAASVAVAAGGFAGWRYLTPSALPPKLMLPSGDMVLVQQGAALLGAKGEQVQVPSFYIDETEVTNRAYLAFCKATGREVPPGAEGKPLANPVVNVTFDDAKAFALWAGKRLPTDAEWEKAARGPKGQKYPWGNEFRYEVINLSKDKDSAATAVLAAADAFSAGRSPYGALNMVGNVWEWVATPAKPDDFQIEVLTRTLKPPPSRTEPFYQIRGGSYNYYPPADSLPDLVWDWGAMPARMQRYDIGFRCAKDP